MKKIKLAVFDMEGTLFKRSYGFDFIKEQDRFKENWEKLCESHPGNELSEIQFSSAWTLLCDLLGPEASKKNQANWEKWRDGGYPGYSEWVIDTIKIHKDEGLRKELFDTVVNESAVYFQGVAETFAALREQNITIALVSGGLKAMADRVALDFGLEHCFTSAEYFWNFDGTIRHWNCQPSDFIHKKHLVKLLLHDLGFSKDEAVFIGDGGNDREVAQYVGHSIGFNPKPYHEFFWDDFVRGDNLQLVLGPLGISPTTSLCDAKQLRSDTTLSDQITKKVFRKFLIDHGGLTENSSRSYLTYLNSILINMQGTKTEALNSRTPLQLLVESAKSAKSEASFIKALSKPLAGAEGRIGDLTSTAKQFYRFNHSIRKEE